MKMSVGKRLLMLAHWLFFLLLGAALAVCLIVPGFFADMYDRLQASVGALGARIVGIALLALCLVLAAAQLCAIVRRKKRGERGFIVVESSETGHVRIAVAAVEQMVRQSVRNIDGIAEMKIDIDSQGDALAININASIANGSHVPTLTANMRRSIRQFVEMNCGVSVSTVSISINSVSNAQDAPRRRFGKGKVGAARSGDLREPAEQTGNDAANASAVETDDGILTGEETEVLNAEDEPQTEIDENETEVYNLDAPYESQFARDLAETRMNGTEGASADAADPSQTDEGPRSI